LNLNIENNNFLKAAGAASTMLHPGIQTTDATLIIDGTGKLTSEGDCGIGGYKTSLNSGVITINGGRIIAKGENASGIGSGSTYSWFPGGGGPVTINGGTVTATAGDQGHGIGSKLTGYEGTLTMNGNGVVFTSSVSDNDSKRTNGILFIGNPGNAFGTVTIGTDFTISGTNMLTIATDATVNIPMGFTITNEGSVTNNGRVYKCGTITGDGTWNGNAAVSACPQITTTELEDGTEDEAYSETLEADSEFAVTWSIEEGDLPEGLTLDPTTGEISGTPAEHGTFDFTVKAANHMGYDIQDLSIIILPNVGIDCITQSQLTAWSQNGILYVSGLTPGDKWSVYTITGILIYEAESGTSASLSNREKAESVVLPRNGIYIVKSGNKTVKVIL
jgi:hypothetical protein